MFTVAGYTLDRIVRLTEEEAETTIELLSGQICFIPHLNWRTEALIAWAKDSLALEDPMALRIVNDEVVHAAEYTYRPIRSVHLVDEQTIEVRLLGRPGPYRMTRTLAERYMPVLMRSIQEERKLFLLISDGIDAVIDLSPEESEAFIALGAISHATPPKDFTPVTDPFLFPLAVPTADMP